MRQHVGEPRVPGLPSECDDGRHTECEAHLAHCHPVHTHSEHDGRLAKLVERQLAHRVAPTCRRACPLQNGLEQLFNRLAARQPNGKALLVQVGVHEQHAHEQLVLGDATFSTGARGAPACAIERIAHPPVVP
eukprot:6106077-Prymnesium_polylepis.2